MVNVPKEGVVNSLPEATVNKLLSIKYAVHR